MHTSLFAPAPQRKARLILTLAGSLLFHGSLIGVAALWRTSPVADPVHGPTEVSLVEPLPPGETPPLAAAPPSEPEVAQPVFKVSEPLAEPPPTDEPSLEDMKLATPPPARSAARTATRPASTSAQTRAVSVPGSVAASGATGNPGTGRPGAAGGRWTTPEPPYPAALRLARVHGNGSVRVTTDGMGRVVSATMAQSTGNALLDDHTCRTAKTLWSGPPNSTVLIPITYRLQ